MITRGVTHVRLIVMSEYVLSLNFVVFVMLKKLTKLKSIAYFKPVNAI